MRRACKLSLKFVTDSKLKKINNLLLEYRRVTNFYIKTLWDHPGKLDKETLARCSNTGLSERYKSQALKQALETVISTKKAAKLLKKYVTMPVFNGAMTLDSKFVTIEDGRGSFDLAVKLSTLQKGKRVTILTKKTKPLNKWLAKPDSKLIQGCSLSENNLTVWVEILYREPKEGRVIGIDIGVNKIISTSDGDHFGKEFKPIRDKINRKKPGSKNRKQSCDERKNYINQQCNKIPWNDLNTIGVENLVGMKKGKKTNRSKKFRKALVPWTYRQVITRVSNKAQENRVCLVKVSPTKTSQTCPECSTVDKLNRQGENFKCIVCNYTNDADTVGALNVLARTLATL